MIVNPGIRRFSGIKPALNLVFTGGESISSMITFTRASGGTRVNSAGLIETLTTDQPRFDYDPVTLAPRGLLIEESRVNNFLNATIDGATLGTQGVTITAVPWTVSFYGTGTITFSGAYAGSPLVGSGAYPTRSSVTFTPSAGTLTCTVTGTVSYAQCELGSFATSFIPTAGASVTRAADVASMTGTNFSSWFNATEGTFVASADSYGRAASTYPNVISASIVGASTDRISLYFNANTSVAGEIRVANVGVSGQYITHSGSAAVRMATAYKVNDANSAANGVVDVADAPPSLPTVTGLSIGSTAVGGTPNLNGHLQRITYYNKRLSDATLKALSA